MKSFGTFIGIAGLLMAIYALLFFEVSVPSGNGDTRINNIGLMQDRQNLLIFGGFAAMAGLLMVALAPRRAKQVEPDVPASKQPERRGPGVNELAFKSAIEWDEPAKLKELIDGGIKAYGEMATGRGYLQYAVLRKSTKAIQILLANGAVATWKDSHGTSALELAEQADDKEAIALLGGAEKVPAVADAASSPAAPAPAKSLAEQLETLARLRASGALSEQEFESAKARAFSRK